MQELSQACACQSALPENNLLSEAQAGFREGRLTGTCLTQFLHNVYAGIDQGCAVGVLFLDLAKAFDSVDHNILLDKLRCLGFKASSVTWFKSYLSNRTQRTCVNNICSDSQHICCGVPQGSILGPLLFIIFINDLPSYMNHCHLHLYADDTALSISAESNVELRVRLAECLATAYNWMCRNKLCLNLSKSKVMVFGSSYTVSEVQILDISVGSHEIDLVDKHKYLGIILDRTLTFGEHVRYLKGMLGKLRPVVGQVMSLKLYSSLILPVLDYADIVYDCLSAKKL